MPLVAPKSACEHATVKISQCTGAEYLHCAKWTCGINPSGHSCALCKDGQFNPLPASVPPQGPVVSPITVAIAPSAPVSDVSASSLPACPHRGARIGTRPCSECQKKNPNFRAAVVYACPFRPKRGASFAECRPCDKRTAPAPKAAQTIIPASGKCSPSTGDASAEGLRAIILSQPGYRIPQTERFAASLPGSPTLTTTYQPEPGPVLAAARDAGSVAAIRWEEQGCMFGGRRSGKIFAAALWDAGVAPLALDYGGLDHYNARSLDLYLPSGKSHITEEWPSLPDTEPDWTAQDPRLRAYVERTRALYQKARKLGPLEGLPQDYVAVFAQCSAGLCRLPVQASDDRGRASDYLIRLHQSLTAAGLKMAVKFGPIGAKTPPPELKDVPYFTAGPVGSDENTLINARFAVHARNVVIITSSVSIEFLLAGLPVMATGRSWFNGLGVYDEARDWADAARMPAVDPAARNRYMQWWTRHQFYPETAPQALADRVAEFRRLRRLRDLTTVTCVYAADARMEALTLQSLTATLRETPGARHIAAIDLASADFKQRIAALGFEVQEPASGKPPRMTTNLRAALDSSTTPLFLTVEADVTLHPGAVAPLLDALESAPAEVVAVESVMVRGKRPIYPSAHRVTPRQLADNGLVPDPRQPTFCATLWRADVLRKTDWTGIRQLTWGDADLWQRILLVRPDASALSVCASTADHVGHAFRMPPKAPEQAAAKAAAPAALIPPPALRPRPTPAPHAALEIVRARWAESNGWMRGHSQNPYEFAQWFDRVRNLDADRYLEIGSNEGRSLWLIQDALRPGATIVSVDISDVTPRGTPLTPTLEKLRAAGFTVIFLKADSKSPDTVAAVAAALRGPTDVLFIDGDHSRAGVTADYHAYRGLVRAGGIIGFHDIVTRNCGVKDLWSDLKAQTPGAVEIVKSGSMGIGVIPC